MAKAELSRGGIYCIRNLVSGRIYVGSSINIRSRWKSHRSLLRAGQHIARAMQRSWLKHGEAAFEFSILEFVDEPAELVAREQHWIDALDAANPRTGFNSSPTAGNCLGVRHSAETKRKLSKVHKGKPKSAEHRAAIGDAHRGRTRSAEERAKTAEGVRRYFAEHPEARERMREVGRRNGALSKGRKLSAEQCRRMSEVRKNNPKFRAAAIANLQRRRSPKASTEGEE